MQPPMTYPMVHFLLMRHIIDVYGIWNAYKDVAECYDGAGRNGSVVRMGMVWFEFFFFLNKVQEKDRTKCVICFHKNCYRLEIETVSQNVFRFLFLARKPTQT